MDNVKAGIGAFALGVFVAQWAAVLWPKRAAAWGPWPGNIALGASVVVSASTALGLWAGALVLLAVAALIFLAKHARP